MYQSLCDEALENLIFERDYIIKKYDKNYSITVSITTVRQDESGYANSITYMPVTDITGDNIFQLVENLNKDFMLFLRFHLVISEDQKYIFRFEKFSGNVEINQLIPTGDYKTFEVEWNVTKNIAEILGLEVLSFKSIPEITKPSIFPKTIEWFYDFTSRLNDLESKTVQVYEINDLKIQFNLQMNKFIISTGKKKLSLKPIAFEILLMLSNYDTDIEKVQIEQDKFSSIWVIKLYDAYLIRYGNKPQSYFITISANDLNLVSYDYSKILKKVQDEKLYYIQNVSANPILWENFNNYKAKYNSLTKDSNSE